MKTNLIDSIFYCAHHLGCYKEGKYSRFVRFVFSTSESDLLLSFRRHYLDILIKIPFEAF
jgi:hypothetical protein